MNYSLALTLQSQPEVLERVLRVVRHRGFRLTNLTMGINDSGQTLVDMQVRSERAVELLTHQLTKLIDVTECKVEATKPQS
ncbi:MULTISPECIES: acetolactate synthase 2 small subunit [Shewanella]|uniref:acetolactate synthase 2 small subunit n=1 Tax=Shewanella TaxID=22 RepID=UPI00048EE2F9|nr:MULTISPECIES: acetolactate synthase 2 small subunit [Shewanella]QLE83990.1 acetolactate synthase 2 small subunit [Shewanella sp. Scap07]